MFERDRTALADTIGNYLLPRIEQESGPIRIVFAGPTGSGKSTLLNSVVGNDVSRSGSIRPTTTKPLAYVREGEAPRFNDDPLGYEVVVAEAPILSRVTLIDTPDIDSTNTTNHFIAEKVVATADIIVFVASALRYADLVPWQLLRRAQDRGIPVIHVLNRISTSSAGAANDMRRLLRSESMTGPLVRVEEHHLGPKRLVPAAGVRNLKRAILDAIETFDTESRHVLEASVRDVAVRSAQLFDDITSQVELTDGLRTTLKDHLVAESDVAFSPPTSKWSEILKMSEAGTHPTGRWLRRHGLSIRLTQPVGKMIRSEIVGMLEQRLRLFDLAHDGLVIDLTGSETKSPAIYRAIDVGVSDWYCALARESGDEDVDAYRRATAAITACEAKTADGGPDAGLDLLLDRLADDIAGMVLPYTHDEPVQMAVTSASAIVDRLIGARALSNA